MRNVYITSNDVEQLIIDYFLVVGIERRFYAVR